MPAPRPSAAQYDTAIIVERDSKFIVRAADRDDRPEVPHDKREAAEAFLQSLGLVETTVRPGGKYAGRMGGQVVWVTAREYQTVRHTLISRADAATEAESAAAAVSKQSDGASLFRSFRKSYRASAEAVQRATAERKKREFEALGFTAKA
jgi:hypothetical protein